MIKKRWQEYIELYKKGLNNQDNQDGVVPHLEPDILKCEVKWILSFHGEVGFLSPPHGSKLDHGCFYQQDAGDELQARPGQATQAPGCWSPENMVHERLPPHTEDPEDAMLERERGQAAPGT